MEAPISPGRRTLLKAGASTLAMPVVGAVAQPAASHQEATTFDLWVISDEIYARIVFEGQYRSIWSETGMPERTVIIDGFSKSFAMTGWRLGYAVAPIQVIDAMDLLVLNTFTCAAEFTQIAAMEALRDSTGAVEAMVGEYKLRRDLFVGSLGRIPGFRCAVPQGAFYAWVNIQDTGLPAEELQRILLEEAGVAVIAGAAFGAEGRNYLRFSLVSARHLLEEALDRIERVSVKWRAVPA